MALSTRARVAVLTTLALFSTRETVAVDTLARRATCSRFMFLTLYRLFRGSAYRAYPQTPRAHAARLSCPPKRLTTRYVVTAFTGLSRPIQPKAGHVLEMGAVQRPQPRF